MANLTENPGAFAEVGYEWIDEGRLSAAGRPAVGDLTSGPGKTQGPGLVSEPRASNAFSCRLEEGALALNAP